MKKNYFLFLMTLAFTGLNAQITFTNNNLAQAGVTFNFSTDTLVLGAILPGEPGENKTWDFTALVEHEEYDIVFVLPSWTPYPDEFPESNFAAYISDDDGDSYAFFNRDDEELSAIGLAGNYDDFGLFVVDLEPKEIYFDFPVQYGDSREETFYFEVNLGDILPPFDSIRFKQTTNKVTAVDAWGNLILSLGSYDVLRIKEDRIVADSIWGKVAGFWSLLTSDEVVYTDYDWISDDATIGYTLVSMEYDSDIQNVSDVDFMKTLPVGVKEKIITDISIYPIPSNGNITFKFNEDVDGEIIIYDSQARRISRLLVNSKIVNLDLSKMSSGVYFYIYKNDNGELVNQGKLIIE